MEISTVDLIGKERAVALARLNKTTVEKEVPYENIELKIHPILVNSRGPDRQGD